jgi:N4-gp56 family major capsid protein
MGFTAFGAQQPEQKRAWRNKSIEAYREINFWEKFLGASNNSIVQVINELKSTSKGDRAMIALVQDARMTGIVGDNDIADRRETLEANWQEIHTDQLRKSFSTKGRVDDQQSVLDVRTEMKDKGAYWRAAIQEELLFLTACGISYDKNTDGSTRSLGGEDDLRTLEFAADVAVPTNGRHYNFNGTTFTLGDTTAIAATYLPTYGMIVDAAAEARTKGIKPLRVDGTDHYVYLCHPKTFAALKKDSSFRDAVVGAGERGKKHPIFTGGTLTMDGIIIHTNTRVFNTIGAASGAKWGAGGTVNGTRSLLLGCQAMALADLWSGAQWDEEILDAGAKKAVTISQYIGMKKLQFNSRVDSNTVQDFGMLSINLAIG